MVTELCEYNPMNIEVLKDSIKCTYLSFPLLSMENQIQDAVSRLSFQSQVESVYRAERTDYQAFQWLRFR